MSTDENTPAEKQAPRSRFTKYIKYAMYLVGVRTGQARFWELDYLRAIAIIWMVIFHLLWDLMFFRLIDSSVFNAYANALGPPGLRPIFFVLVGVSLSISYRRSLARQLPASILFQRLLMRGLLIFCWGLIISGIVLIVGTGRIDFGVLHSIGVSVAIAFPLLHLRAFKWCWGLPALMLGIFLIATGIYLELNSVTANHSWLLWLGIRSPGYSSLDYFPLLPWFGVVCIGIFLGNLLYTPEKRLFRFPELPQNRALNLIQLIGSNALLIYLVHQPILYGIVYLIAL